MFIQVGLERKRLIALVTDETLHGRVSLDVGPEVGAIGERLAAVGAAVGLLARVRAQVALQQPRPRERLAADVALVRQLVRQHVHRQRRHADVGLAAGDALLGALRVDAAVGLLVA